MNLSELQRRVHQAALEREGYMTSRGKTYNDRAQTQTLPVYPHTRLSLREPRWPSERDDFFMLRHQRREYQHAWRWSSVSKATEKHSKPQAKSASIPFCKLLLTVPIPDHSYPTNLVQQSATAMPTTTILHAGSDEQECGHTETLRLPATAILIATRPDSDSGSAAITRIHQPRLRHPPFFVSEKRPPTQSLLISSPQTHSTPSQTSSDAQTPSTSASPNNSHTSYSVSDKHGPGNHTENHTSDRGGGKRHTSSGHTRWKSCAVSKSSGEDKRCPC